MRGVGQWESVLQSEQQWLGRLGSLAARRQPPLCLGACLPLALGAIFPLLMTYTGGNCKHPISFSFGDQRPWDLKYRHIRTNRSHRRVGGECRNRVLGGGRGLMLPLIKHHVSLTFEHSRFIHRLDLRVAEIIPTPRGALQRDGAPFSTSILPRGFTAVFPIQGQIQYTCFSATSSTPRASPTCESFQNRARHPV